MAGTPPLTPVMASQRWRAATIERVAMVLQTPPSVSWAATGLRPPTGTACRFCLHASGPGTLCTGLCELSPDEALAELDRYGPVRPRAPGESLFSWFTRQPNKRVEMTGPNGKSQTRVLTPMRREWLERQLDRVEAGLATGDEGEVTTAMAILRRLSFDDVDLEQLLSEAPARTGFPRESNGSCP